MRLDGDWWTLRREGTPVAQRLAGTLSANGATIPSRWEPALNGDDLQTDFEMTYARVA
jgi:hypothetical protein